MATEFMDDFGGYGTNVAFLANGVYAGVGGALVADPDPSGTGQIVFRLNAANNTLRKVLSGALTTVGWAQRLWLSSLPTSSSSTFTMEFRDNNNTRQVSIGVSTTGQIAAYRGQYSSGTLLGQTSDPVLVANAWQHIEAKVVFNNTTGSIEVRVEDVPVLVLTNIDTVDTGLVECSQIQLAVGVSYLGNAYTKDLILWNALGALNTTFFGNCSVVPMIPDADISLNWTPSTGTTGYNLIDESPPNDNTDYIYAATPPPSPALFGLSNLPADITTVKSIMTMVRSAKSDAGDGDLQVGIKSGATTGLGTDRPMTTAYTYWMDPMDADPATAGAWTVVAANAVQLQLNRTL